MFEKIANIFASPTSASVSSSRWACWRSIAWARTSHAGHQRRGCWRSSSIRTPARAWPGRSVLGGNLRKLTIFALGIMPYITASIIFQLLTVIYEPLAKLQKEGELGRRKITQWTRYVTVLLGIVQSFAIA
jgi:hypothetical protein